MTEDEIPQEVTLTELGGTGGKEILGEEVEEEAEDGLLHPTPLSPTTIPSAQEEEDGFTYVCE